MIDELGQDEDLCKKIRYNNEFTASKLYRNTYYRWNSSECRINSYARFVDKTTGKMVYVNGDENLKDRIIRLRANSEEERHYQVDLYLQACRVFADAYNTEPATKPLTEQVTN